MTMACKRATELMSKGIDAPLSLPERISLRTHLMMCRYCRRCDDQFHMLRRITEKRRKDDPPEES